jgi:hypothetical protein
MPPAGFTETEDLWGRELARVSEFLRGTRYAHVLPKALRLATAGAVWDLRGARGLWEVDGDHGRYQVDAETMQCTCPYGRYRRASCAHATAVELVQRCLAGGVSLPPRESTMEAVAVIEEAVPDETAAVVPETADLQVPAVAAGSVYRAIAQVASRIARHGVPKGQFNEQQRYKFRGVDDIQTALAPLLADAGLVILPHVVTREVTERPSSKGGTLIYVTVCVEYTLVDSASGTRHTVTVYGEGMDSGDKATNKALSAAYKYMAIQSFCIPLAGQEDGDRETPAVAPRPTPLMTPRPRQDPAAPDYRALIREAFRAAGKTSEEIRTYFQELDRRYAGRDEELQARFPAIYASMKKRLAGQEDVAHAN